MTEVYRAVAAMGPAVHGTVLAARDGFSARYDLDRTKGVFSRPSHALAGQSYVGKVLALDTAKGGVATAWMLHEMHARGVMPAALLLNSVNPILVQGAALADFTLLAGFDGDITTLLRSGDEVAIEPDASGGAVVRVLRRAAP